MNNQYKKMINNLFVFLGGSIGSKILVFLLVPFYTSILSTAQFGEIDIITTTVSLLLPVVTVGLTDALFRFSISKDYEHSDVFSLGMIISLCSFVVCAIVLLVLNTVLSWNYMYLMLLLLVSSFLYQMILNFMKGIGHIKVFVITGVIQTFIVLVLNIVFLKFFNGGILGYVLAYVISYFVPIIGLFFCEKLWQYVKLKKISRKTCRDMILYSAPLIPTTISWWIVSSSDKYMVTYFLGAESNGLYSVANKIPQILYSVIMIFTTVWQLSSTEVYEDDKNEMEMYYKSIYKYFCTMGFVLGSCFLVFTKLIMSLMARNDFASGWIYAPFLIDAIIFTSISGFISGIYSSYKKNMGTLISVMIGAVLNIVLNFILIPRFGIQGAAIATCASYYFITVYRLIDTKRFLQFDREIYRMTINSVILIIQSICLIYVEHNRYLIQLLIVSIGLIYNYKILVSVLKKILGDRRII